MIVDFELLKKLRQENISLSRSGDQLKISAPEGKMNPALLQAIRANKEGLLHLLENLATADETIRRAPVQDSYPVTFQQRSIWALSQQAEASCAYNMPMLLRIEGPVDAGLLELCLRQLISRHDVLRTSFFQDEEGELRQKITPLSFRLEQRDISTFTEEQLEQLLYEEGAILFDLGQAPLFRAQLLRSGTAFSCLLLTVHHIICDGYSVELLKKEISDLYAVAVKGEEPLLEPLPVRYTDYAVWQEERAESNAWEKETAYWRGLLGDDLPTVQFGGRPRPALKTFAGSHLDFALPDDTARLLKAWCLHKKLPMYTGLVAGLNALLYRYLGQEDILIGTVSMGRRKAELNGLAGLFINMIPLRTRVSGDASFEEAMDRQQQVLDDAFAHEDLPFGHLVGLLNKPNDLSRSPVFDVLLIYNDHRTTHADDDDVPRFFFTGRDMRKTSQLDLIFSFHVRDSGIMLSVEYNTDLYDSDLVTRFALHYNRLLLSMLRQPAMPLCTLDYLTSEEKDLLLYGFNQTAVAYPEGVTLTSLFREQVCSRGQSIALKFREQVYTYHDLDERSGHVARYLQQYCGIGREDRVAVRLPRSEALVIALLAILKAGAAYVPIGPSFPQERVDYILQDAGCKLCIDTNEIEKIMQAHGEERESVDADSSNENDLAYVLYTSGSTGQPKGCMLEHKGLVNRIEWMWREYGFNHEDVVLQKTSFTFDVSVWELFLPLCWGCTMVLCEEEDVYSPERLVDLIGRHQVSCVHFVPGMLDSFIEAVFAGDAEVPALGSLKRIITSGEALPLRTLRDWYRHSSVPVCNLYGPTEASIDVSFFNTTPQTGRVLIGKPVANTYLYVLDARQQLLPAGIAGEICIGGVQLARGYLNRPGLTDEKFIANPFIAGKKLYRTGDTGRWLPDGNLEYIGRMDNQVKIRGFRIEPAEIEQALQRLPAITAAVVTVFSRSDVDRELVAYFISREQLQPAQLKKELNRMLPAYMVPAFFIQVSSFPVTASGKIDRRRLPSPINDDIEDEASLLPLNEMEHSVREAFRHALKQAEVPAAASFFEMGGDSIKAIRLISKLKALGAPMIDLADLYQYPSVRSLAGRLSEKKDTEITDALVQEIRQDLEEVRQAITLPGIADAYPMSDIQKGMVFSSINNPAQAIYHDQFVYHLSCEAFDAERFSRAWMLLADRHETLRTGFDLSVHTQPLQLVYQNISLPVSYADLRSEPAAEQQQAIAQFMEEERRKPFDLAQAPLWKVQVFQCSAQHIVYLLQFHHAILDGWSVASLNAELALLYTQLEKDPDARPSPLACTNRDAVAGVLLEKNDTSARDFWKEWLYDYKRLEIFGATRILQTHTETYSTDTLEKVRRRTREDRVSARTLFFGAYLYAIRMLSYEGDLTIGLVTNNRPVHEDGDKVLGCFLNTIPFRYKIIPDKSWREYIQDIGKEMQHLKRYERVSLLDISKTQERNGGDENPFFDVLFNYVDFHVYDQVNAGGLSFVDDPVLHGLPAVDAYEVNNTFLSMNVHATGGRLVVDHQLTRNLLSGITLIAFHGYFNAVLHQYLYAPDEKLRKEHILPRGEQHYLVSSLNDTACDYDLEKTVLDLFYEQVDRSPQAPAVSGGDGSLSYHALDARSSQLAHYLQQQGVVHEQSVALLLPRSAELIVAVLGVLKAGCAYVPIDPLYPAQRIAMLVQDSGASLVLTQARYTPGGGAGGEGAVRYVALEQMGLEGRPVSRPATAIRPQQLVYVLYTSGSSGAPKGVMIEHQSLSNYLQWVIRSYTGGGTGNFGLYSSLSFDLTITSLFGSIISGNTLHVFDEGKDVAEILKDYLSSERLDSIKLTPAHIDLIPALGLSSSQIKRAIVGGEQLQLHQVQTLKRLNPDMEIINEYGPTEATVGCSVAIIHSADERITIGRPLSNMQVYVLDSDGELLPAGVTGELYIGGVQLARGYWNNASLTAAKFVAHPFRSGARLYRSGDRGRWTATGALEYLGRLDEQVKIRGYRIEPAEVEGALQGVAGVGTAAVVVGGASASPYLVGYYTADGGLATEQVRSALQAVLPAYLVPARLEAVERLPLTANGKVDRKTLVQWDRDWQQEQQEAAADDTAAASEVEAALCAAYGAVLERVQVGVGQSFFDLGGDSIKAILLVNRLKQRGYGVKVGDVLRYPVVRELALHIQPLNDANPQPSGETDLTPGVLTYKELKAGEVEDLQRKGMVEDVYPLAPLQEGLYFHWLADPDATTYVEQISYHVSGRLQVDELQKSFQYLVDRHGILRTAFTHDYGNANLQVVYAHCACHFEHLLPPAGSDPSAFAQAYKQSDRKKGFDLGEPSQMRLTVIEREPQSYEFIWTHHHILMDGWCASILINEFYTIYHNLLQHKEPALGKPYAYGHYITWLSQQDQAQSLRYWKEYLNDYETTATVPFGAANYQAADYSIGEERFQIDHRQLENIRAVCRQLSITEGSFIQAAWGYLLSRYNGTRDVVFGTVVSGRPGELPGVESTIGLFINTIPVRVRYDADTTIGGLLRQVQADAIDALPHHYSRLSDVQGESPLKNRLFDHMLAYLNYPAYSIIEQGVEEEHAGERLQVLSSEIVTEPNYHFNILVIPVDLGVQVRLQYNGNVYTQNAVRRIARHFEAVLNAFTSSTARSLTDISYVDDEERSLLMGYSTGAQVRFPETAIVTLFDEQVYWMPEHTALVDGARSLSYLQLDEQSNRLANHLRRHGVNQGSIVPVCLPRSMEMIVALLAILKTGAAYLPLDPSYPEERTAHILSDSGAAVVVTGRAYKDFFGKYGAPAVICLDDHASFTSEPATRLEAEPEPGSLAYVMYTSGSTGLPKGVMIEHRSVTNLIRWHIERYDVTPFSRSTVMAGVGFDAATLEIWSALLSGSTLYVVDDETKHSPESLLAFYRSHNITHAFVPPVLIPGLVSAAQPSLLNLRYVLIGGDRLPAVPVGHLGYTLVNQYGPTESTVMVTEQAVSGHLDKLPPIGRPIANTEVYVLDDARQPAPAGVAGEIYIGGAQLARGYLNNPGLTAQKFIDHPFKMGERLYRTGDLGRWLDDGSLEYITRLDDQVKIRGYRIELGEVEHALQQVAGVDSSVVVYNEAGESRYLAAYYTTASALTPEELRAALLSRLPGYMVPAFLVALDVMPVTSNGKVDKKALPALTARVAEKVYLPPCNRIEEALCNAYQQVLGYTDVGAGENFFDLGGDSIKAILLVNRMKQSGYRIMVADVLKHPVISELALQAATLQHTASQQPVEGVGELTPIQHWFFQNNTRNRHHYNQSVMLFSARRIDAAQLELCLQALTAHHDALRLVYREDEQGVHQYNGIVQTCDLQVYEWPGREDVQALMLEQCNRLQTSFDLSAGPLFKAALFRLSDGDRLLLAAHHLVVDGVSWRILLEDLATVYEQLQKGMPVRLPPKTDAFIHWSQRLQDYAQSEALAGELSYWLETVQSRVQGLPLDRAGENRVMDHVSLTFMLDTALTESLLTAVNPVYHTEINDVLLTALGLALDEVFPGADVLMQMEGHGREELFADISIGRTVGWFTSVYPVRLPSLNQDDRFHYLVRVKEQLRAIPRKGIGYGLLRYLGQGSGALEAGGPFDITFNYLGDFGSRVQGAGDEGFAYCFDSKGNEADGLLTLDTPLSITAVTVQGQLQVHIGYSSCQFDASTIERLQNNYSHQLQTLIEELKNQTARYLTPSDFTYRKLSITEALELSKDNSVEDIYELSPLQQGIYFHWLAHPEATAYINQTAYHISGGVDRDCLEKAYQQLVERHALLRTSFTHRYAQTQLQVVKKHRKADFYYEDLSRRPDASSYIGRFRQEDRATPFDLSGGALVRLSVLSLGAAEHQFIWTHHHILMDGWCASILINEFNEIYQSLLRGRSPKLHAAYPYSRYIAWLSQQDQARSLRYWKEYLNGYETVASIPARSQRDSMTGYDQQQELIELGEKKTTRLRQLCKDFSITEGSFIQAAWGYLLSRYNGTRDVVFGTVVSGRPGELPGVESTIGLFINTIPVRVRYDEDTTIGGLLRQVQADAIDALPHHYSRLSDVQATSQPGADLFNHIMVFENYMVQEPAKNGLWELLSLNTIVEENYDFNIIVIPGASIKIVFKYNRNRYAATTMKALCGHFKKVLGCFADGQKERLDAINYLTIAERRRLTDSFNSTAVSYPPDTVVQLFEKQVDRVGSAEALRMGEQTLTYHQLEQRSNQLAHYLRSRSIGRNCLVPVCMNRSFELVIALLGILKSGAAYVPIDPAHPRERIACILNDIEAQTIITETSMQAMMTEQQALPIYLDQPHLDIEAQPLVRPLVPIDPNDLAYVMYTSGSTGTPKGVMICHASLGNYLHWVLAAYIPENGSGAFGLYSSLSFDLTVTSLYGSLIKGRCLHIFETQAETADILRRYFDPRHALDIIKLTPAHIQLLPALDLGKTSVRKVIVGGEQLHASQVHILRQLNPDMEIFNEYGPTEATVGCTVLRITAGSQEVHIGRPIANCSVLLLDKTLQPVPAGVAGEMYIGGRQLALGYWRREELTLERFIDHPFCEGERLYRTGDLARWLEDGNLEYIGRTDDQVKIRGYRVELGEVEAALRSHPQVKEGAAVLHTDAAGEPVLIGYFRGEGALDRQELRSFMATLLPQYMVPALLVQLDEWPLTLNGKLDKSKLPDPHQPVATAGTMPRNQVEEDLAKIWKEVLGISRDISTTDNFFELGGHSIKAIIVLSRIYKTFNITLTIPELLEDPTIRHLSKKILNVGWLNIAPSGKERNEEYEKIEI